MTTRKDKALVQRLDALLASGMGFYKAICEASNQGYDIDLGRLEDLWIAKQHEDEEPGDMGTGRPFRGVNGAFCR